MGDRKGRSYGEKRRAQVDYGLLRVRQNSVFDIRYFYSIWILPLIKNEPLLRLLGINSYADYLEI